MAAEDKSERQMQAAGARVLQSSPGLPEKMVSLSRVPTKAGGVGRDDRDAIIAEQRRDLHSEKDKNRSLEDEYNYRLNTLVRRETQTKNKIDSLERRLNDGFDPDEHMKKMGRIKSMQMAVVSGLECIQNNTAKILQDQEKELVRAFRAELHEVQKELETRSRKGDQDNELVAKNKRLVEDLHEAHGLLHDCDRRNQTIEKEKKKLEEKQKNLEDDSKFLFQELMIERKKVSRLKAQCRQAGVDGASAEPPVNREAETTPVRRRSFSQKQIDQTRLQQTHNKTYEREVAYRDAVQKLKRMVEAERRTVHSLKQQQADMMKQRTELEVLLRQCLDDVKAEILRHRMEAEQKDGSTTAAPPVNSMSVHELTAQDRERVLELLLSQQRVVQLLYSKTFPQQPPSSVEYPAPARTGKEDDFSWLSDIIPQDQ